MAAADDRRMSTRATGVVGIAILSSRLLGLIREMIFAGLFGAGRNLDAFLMAFRLPNLLRDLFAEGALSTAFITTFSKKIAVEGDQSAWRLANKVATLTAVFMSVITLLGIMFAPQLVDLLTWGSWSPDKTELTIQLTRIMWPFMLMVSLAALVMGMLNAKHVFGPPAMASSYFNLGSIIAGVAIGYWIDPHFGARSLVGLAIGTLIGGAWQLIGQFPSLWKVGYRFHPDFHWRDEGVRTVLTLMGPAVIAASAVQVNVLINSGFAASLGNGPVSWLNIAFRLMQLPLGIFGVAIGTVTLPLVSKSAALGNTAEFRAILARGMRLAFLLTVPSAIGLAMLASPIISVIYRARTVHGRDDTGNCGRAAILCDRSRRVCGVESVDAGVLRGRQTQHANGGELSRNRCESISQLVVHVPARVGTPRPCVFNGPRRHDQFSFALRADAPAHAPA